MSGDAERIPTLFITGAPGSGKTALAREIGELLWRAREPHALIDLDELGRGLILGGSTDFNLALAVKNAAAVWANFHAVGARRVILARVIQSADDVDQFAEAIPGSDLIVCRVVADPATALRRIRSREAGSAHAFLSRVAGELAEAIAGLDLPGFTVQNEDETSISDLADDVLVRIDWPRPSGDTSAST